MNDEDYRAYIEQAQLIREMMETPGWAALVDYWNTQMVADKRAVLNGNVSDFERYKTVTGILVGIHKVFDTLLVLDGIIEAERRRRAEFDDAA